MRSTPTLLLLAGLLAAGCTGSSEPSADAPTTSVATPSSGPTSTEPGEPAPTSSASSTPSAPSTPSRPHIDVPRRHSLQAVMRKEYDGRDLRRMRTVGDFGSYTRYEVRYRSDGLWVTGVLNVPDGRGPFPALVLNHGYIEPSIYVTGQGLSREQDYLARSGFVVLHTDYRGHAGSDPVSLLDRETRIGYTEDVITAVQALRRLRYVDDERVGLLGRSMGGGVTYNVLVAKPRLVDAAVVYAPVSSSYEDNFERWTVPERPDVAAVVRDRLRPTGPAFEDLSARTFFDRVRTPLLIHHGTADESCPLRWSRATTRALERAGADVRYVVYPGEPHAFITDWERSMERTVAFLERELELRT